jgi:hypothetical protein
MEVLTRAKMTIIACLMYRDTELSTRNLTSPRRLDANPLRKSGVRRGKEKKIPGKGNKPASSKDRQQSSKPGFPQTPRKEEKGSLRSPPPEFLTMPAEAGGPGTGRTQSR